jgi:hypothetical protein
MPQHGFERDPLTDDACLSVESYLRVRTYIELVCFHLRDHALIRVNHCRMDDPLIWGVLPFRYAFNPTNHRWAFGSHDICFTNKSDTDRTSIAHQHADSETGFGLHSSLLGRPFPPIGSCILLTEASFNLP